VFLAFIFSGNLYTTHVDFLKYIYTLGYGLDFKVAGKVGTGIEDDRELN